ncbi:MAG: hypothetical protein ABJ308_17255 [Halieaceae bacterium]
MKRHALVLAIGSMAAGSALGVDLDNPSSKAVTYASEVTIPAAGAQITTAEDVVGAVGFGITAGGSRFLRYDLPGAKFLALPSLSFPGQSGSNIVYVSGGVGFSFVIFEVSADAATSIPPTDIATMSFGLASPNVSLDGDSATVTYGIYFTAPGAVNQNPADVLATSSALLFEFTPGTGVASTTDTTGTSPLEIEFASGSTNFVGGFTRSAIGAFYATEVPGNQFLLDGATDVSIAASRAPSTTLSITGDFTATADATTGAYDTSKVFLSNDACASDVLTSTTLNAGEAVFTLGNTSYGTINTVPPLSSGPDICIEVNGVSVIAESAYTALYEPVAMPGYQLPEVSIELGSLQENSASEAQNLVLTPLSIGGAYDSYIRVTNTSPVAGDVKFRMVNDLGDLGPSVSLADVIEGTSSRLAVGGSTQNIDISLIYEASVNLDPSWDVAAQPRRKLRLITTGDFTSIATQVITLSTDGTTFSTF